MAPKRKAKASAPAAKVRKPNDWRAPLFYWRGTTGENGGWVGTWVASEEGLPSDAEFKAAPTTFSLVADKALTNYGHTGSFVSGSYKLDQGDGLGNYSDLLHIFHVRATDNDKGSDGVVVGACGNTEFGRFISLGVLELRGSQTQLTLARRYIADNDPRAKLTAAEVASLPGQNCQAPWVDDLPWKVAACWKLPATSSPANVAMTAPLAADDHPRSQSITAVPSFIGSSFKTKVEYEAWLDEYGLQAGDRLPCSISLNVLDH